jgi:hypothetical protein
MVMVLPGVDFGIFAYQKCLTIWYFYDNLVSLRLFGIHSCGNFVSIFPLLVMLIKEKSGNPEHAMSSHPF